MVVNKAAMPISIDMPSIGTRNPSEPRTARMRNVMIIREKETHARILFSGGFSGAALCSSVKIM